MTRSKIERFGAKSLTGRANLKTRKEWDKLNERFESL